MKKFQVLLAGLMILTCAAMANTALAGQKTEELQGRQDIQVDQIQQGVDAGTVTPHEAKQLVNGQNKINQTAHKALNDDKLTRREFHKLEKMQNKESQNIEKKMDNPDK